MRESELHEHIYRRTTDLTARFPHIQTGPGDDGAVVRTPSRDRLTITTDQLVEGRHFESALLATAEGLDLVARKAVARSISDLAAMGASPAWSLATALLFQTAIDSPSAFMAKSWPDWLPVVTVLRRVSVPMGVPSEAKRRTMTSASSKNMPRWLNRTVKSPCGPMAGTASV